MSKKNKPQSTAPTKDQKVFSTLDDVTALCASEIPVEFVFNGNPCRLMMRRLTPYEQELLKLQLDTILPPLIKGKTEADDRWDTSNPDYLQKKTRIEREVRAQAVFWGSAELQAKRPDLAKVMHQAASRLAIVAFIQGAPGESTAVLTDEILETLYAAICAPEVSVGSLINFFSNAGEAALQP